MGLLFHPAYDDEIIRLIGIVAIEGAALDFILGRILVRFVKPDQAQHLQHEDGFDTRRKEDELKKVSGLPEVIHEVLKLMPDIRVDRNFAIHGLDAYSTIDPRLSDPIGIATRGKYREEPAIRNKDWFNSLIRRISDASAALIDFADMAPPAS